MLFLIYNSGIVNKHSFTTKAISYLLTKTYTVQIRSRKYFSYLFSAHFPFLKTAKITDKITRGLRNQKSNSGRFFARVAGCG
jgi:hypothetical protein